VRRSPTQRSSSETIVGEERYWITGSPRRNLVRHLQLHDAFSCFNYFENRRANAAPEVHYGAGAAGLEIIERSDMRVSEVKHVYIVSNC
jgi:hypothetical protein